MVEGFAKGVKYALFFANVIIFTGGLVVFSIGVWTLSDKSFMERLLGSNLYVASAAILIATGLVVTIISFLGTLGAYREIRCMLLIFFVILFIIFVVMLVGGILGYIFRSEVDERMHTEMVASIKSYKEDSKVTDAWDSVQRNLECCGVLPFTDSQSVIKNQGRKPYDIWFKEGKFKAQTVPESCCSANNNIGPGNRASGGGGSNSNSNNNIPGPGAIQQDQNRKSPQDTCNAKSNIHQDSCYEKMKDFVKGHALLVGGLGIGIACLLVLGMVLSCALFLMIK